MKELLNLMALYNQVTNRALYELLQGQNSTLVTQDAKSCYNNILGLLNHILVADLDWLTACRKGNLEFPVLDSPVLDFKHPGWRKNLYDNLPDLWKHRQSTDNLFIHFIEATPSKLLEGDIDLTNPKGETYTFKFGKILMHMFNHQTHHRGAIAQILDAGAIENDFSNLLELLLK